MAHIHTHTHSETNLHATTASSAIDEPPLLLLLQTNKKQKQSELATQIHTYTNTYTYTWPIPIEFIQSASQSAIYPSIQSYVRPSINASSKAFNNPFISIEMCEDYMFRQTRNCARICQATKPPSRCPHLPSPRSPRHSSSSIG